MEDQELVKISVKSTRDVLFTSIRKKQAWSEKKYKNHRQVEYHHTLKRKTLSSTVHETRAWDISFMKRVCYQLSYTSE